jgi:hypothetical protein
VSDGDLPHDSVKSLTPSDTGVMPQKIQPSSCITNSFLPFAPGEPVLRALWVCVKSDSGWRLRCQSDPSGRYGLLFVSIVRSSTRCIRLTTPRSQNWWKRAHLTHGSLRNARGLVGRFLQPCLLLIHLTGRSELALQVSWSRCLDSRRFLHSQHDLLGHHRSRRQFAGLQSTTSRRRCTGKTSGNGNGSRTCA